MKGHSTPRSKSEIARDLVSLCKQRIKVTDLLYKMRMNHVVLKKHLNSVINAGLITRDHEGLYLITEKGREFLKISDQYSEYLGLYKPQISNF